MLVGRFVQKPPKRLVGMYVQKQGGWLVGMCVQKPGGSWECTSRSHRFFGTESGAIAIAQLNTAFTAFTVRITFTFALKGTKGKLTKERCMLLSSKLFPVC